MAREFYDYNMNEYLRGRSVYTNREAPLLDVDAARGTCTTSRARVAMYTLRERLGADAVNGALRRFREKYAGADAPPPTSRALTRSCKAVTPDSLKPLLSDLFEHITLWDVRTDSGEGRAGRGRGVPRDAVRRRVEGARRQHRQPDAVGDGRPRRDRRLRRQPRVSGSPGESLYLKQHRIRAGKQAIVIIVPRQPTRAGIDPYRKLIERERDDNVGEIGTSPPK